MVAVNRDDGNVDSTSVYSFVNSLLMILHIAIKGLTPNQIADWVDKLDDLEIEILYISNVICVDLSQDQLDDLLRT